MHPRQHGARECKKSRKRNNKTQQLDNSTSTTPNRISSTAYSTHNDNIIKHPTYVGAAVVESPVTRTSKKRTAKQWCVSRRLAAGEKASPVCATTGLLPWCSHHRATGPRSFSFSFSSWLVLLRNEEHVCCARRGRFLLVGFL